MRYHAGRRLLLLSLILFMALPFNTTAGQPSTVTTVEPDTSGCEKCRCFRGRPQSHCRLFWITEVGFMTTLASKNSNTEYADWSLLTFDVGYMFNVSAKDAIGASVFVRAGLEGEDSYMGFRPRYRRWLTKKIGFDASLGIGSWRYDTDRTAYPLILQMKLSVEDYFSLTIQADRAELTGSRWDSDRKEWFDNESYTVTTLSAGLTLGSYPALIGTGILAIVAVLIVNQPTVTPF
ncbi:MAG: hypothetical protein JSU74_07150 [Candidatus Zixiibacteriota bacterium]|nr:MAG: hypothetical protein JSU74_07150 [candidate division Zixibacteria bacterium]